MTENPFPYSCDNKRYHTLRYYLQRRFPDFRAVKAPLEAGFTCPNLDGSRGVGGCTYCLSGSGQFAKSASLSITQQLEAEKIRIEKKWANARLIAYFQSHTNTYAPTARLRALYEEALSLPFVCALSVATRADALSPETVAYLGALASTTCLTVELGLQTVHDETARRINRGHTRQEFLTGYTALKKAGVRVCVHLINGLPGEGPAEMEETARQVGLLRPDGVKIHLLHILKGTAMEAELAEGRVIPMEKDAYVATVVRQLELLPPETVIERLTGDGPKELLLAPRWSTDKISVLGGIDKALATENTCQGARFSALPGRL